MNRKIVSGIMLTMLLTGMLTLALKIRPARAEPVVLGIELKYRTPYALSKGWIYVLVEASVFDGIEASLKQYATDLESIEGFSVAIYTVSTSNVTAIRSFLQQSLPEGLVGCLLIGDVPRAYYEWVDLEFGTYYKIPTDFYYMDLDGVWSDTDGNGAYDKHIGEVCAEIWVGSLQPPSDDISLLNNYFKKSHLYRTGKLALPKRALVYLDVYDEPPWTELFFNSVKVAYEDTVLVAEDEITIASDYRKRLLEGYEWIYLGSHGSSGSHTFELYGGWDGTIYCWDYQSIDPRTFFYVFNTCGSTAGKYSIAGSAVFADTYGLLAMGDQASADTTLQTHKYRIEFWEALSKGKCIGEAYLEDIKIYESILITDPEYEIPGEEYGWQIVGDPSLHIHGYPAVAQLTVTSLPFIGITFAINGVQETTPYTKRLLEGSYTLEMPETQDGYVWSHWLEDEDTNRSKIVYMDTDITLTAVFFHIADLNHDSKVDMKDIAIAASAFGGFPTHPRWNPICDLNGDDKIDLKDIGTVAKNFGKTHPYYE